MLKQAWRELSRERQPAEFWTESELEAHSFPLYPASKPSSRLSEAVRESAR